MLFRTEIYIEPTPVKITYNDPAMFLGSCFAVSIGEKFKTGRMPVLINPSGTMFNPVSVSKTLSNIIKGTVVSEKDLFEFDGKWVSFDHYTEFSSDNPDKVLEKVNTATRLANQFIGKAKFLFITFGTARIYRLKGTGSVVSNCHKIPSGYFSQDLMKTDDITGIWLPVLDEIKTLYPNLKIIFTISPVRHWKDGPHGNTISKSTLFMAVEELLKHSSEPMYFPAYELLMDDLRDYRFYDSDMLHPSAEAIDYIWDKFTGCYFDINTLNLWNEAETIFKGFNHILKTNDLSGLKKFALVMLMKISEFENKVPIVDFTSEKEYFKKFI